MSETTSPLQGGGTTDYMIERIHSRAEGLVAIPIAGPAPQAPTFVRMHAPIEFETVVWAATCKGGPPQIPSWESFIQGGNRIFLFGQRSGQVPTPTVSGHFFTVAGVYHYALVSTEGLDSDFALGVNPWEKNRILASDNYIPASNFLTDLLGKKGYANIPAQFQSPIQGG